MSEKPIIGRKVFCAENFRLSISRLQATALMTRLLCEIKLLELR